MKRKYAVFTGVFALLLVVAIQVVEQVDAPFLSVKANPTPMYRTVPAPTNVFLFIRIESPKENTSYINGTINLCFNATIYGPNNITKGLSVASYKGDWMEKDAWVPYPNTADHFQNFLQFSVNVTDIPFGEHSLNITAHARGEFEDKSNFKYMFSLNKTSSINFSVRTNPIITFPSFENVTFTNSSLPLNFTVDHIVSEMAYSLDGQPSVSISGNTTLTGLSNGQHNVTIYATDEDGYTGTSDTLLFNVNAPQSTEFSVVTLVIAFVVVVVIVGAGLLVYFKKLKRKVDS
jgi:hypothetical protein